MYRPLDYDKASMKQGRCYLLCVCHIMKEEMKSQTASRLAPKYLVTKVQ